MEGDFVIYTETVKIPLKDVENGNVISDRGILEIFENVATHHSDSVHDGLNEIKEKGKAWVIIDWKIQVISRPKYGGVLKVNTWSRENNIQVHKIATYRDFEMYDEENNLCVIGTSKWVIMNIENGRIAYIDKELQERYKPEEKSVFDTWDIEKLQQPKESLNEIVYTVPRADVDFNSHMHNIYYLNLAYLALPEDIYELRPFNNIRISYKREIKLGDIVKCKYVSENGKYIVTIYSADESKVHSIVILE